MFTDKIAHDELYWGGSLLSVDIVSNVTQSVVKLGKREAKDPQGNFFFLSWGHLFELIKLKSLAQFSTPLIMTSPWNIPTSIKFYVNFDVTLNTKHSTSKFLSMLINSDAGNSRFLIRFAFSLQWK